MTDENVPGSKYVNVLADNINDVNDNNNSNHKNKNTECLIWVVAFLLRIEDPGWNPEAHAIVAVYSQYRS
jgi:hypothetical protein